MRAFENDDLPVFVQFHSELFIQIIVDVRDRKVERNLGGGFVPPSLCFDKNIMRYNGQK